jgi:hypothetical protein
LTLLAEIIPRNGKTGYKVFIPGVKLHDSADVEWVGILLDLNLLFHQNLAQKKELLFHIVTLIVVRKNPHILTF